MVGERPSNLGHQFVETVKNHKQFPDSKDPAGSVKTYVYGIMAHLRRTAVDDFNLNESKTKQK